MSATSDFKHSIIQTLKHNRDGSYKTQANRKERLLLIAVQLAHAGYKLRHLKQLKLKHVQYLVNRWLQEQLRPGTIKNRMTDLRWAMQKYGKPTMIPAKNETLNIPKRRTVTNDNKAIRLSAGDLSKITDGNVKMSLMLQRAFGLRREESIKIRINQAVVGDTLRLTGSWCKNGRPRTVKIHYPEQWQVIKQVQAFVGKSQRALIPPHKTYVAQETLYDNQLKHAGIQHAHGLRHAYAQKRYYDLTGWLCPAQGGPLTKDLNEAQRRLDAVARAVISEELGHERASVLAVYCGK